MSLAQIRDEWHVPARLGQKVAVHIPGDPVYYGQITGCTGDGMVLAKFDALPVDQVVHPRGIAYLKS